MASRGEIVATLVASISEMGFGYSRTSHCCGGRIKKIYSHATGLEIVIERGKNARLRKKNFLILEIKIDKYHEQKTEIDSSIRAEIAQRIHQ